MLIGILKGKRDGIRYAENFRHAHGKDEIMGCLYANAIAMYTAKARHMVDI